MYHDQDRAFRYAILVSIALHGMLLFGFSALREPGSRVPAPEPIVARLVKAVPAAVPQPEPVKPQVRGKPPPVVKPVPAHKPRPVAKAETKTPAKPAPQPSAPAAESAVETFSENAVETPSSSLPASAADPPATPSGGPVVAELEPMPAPASPSAEAFDAGSLAQYRLQVISAARKYKRYPRVAMDNTWEGDVVVRMVIGTNGMISALSVKSSSGYEVLDRQALEMFKRAKPLVQIPPALSGKEFTIELRAIYSLKDRESS